MKSMTIMKRFRRGRDRTTIFQHMSLEQANRVASGLNKERKRHDQHWFVVLEE